ncbi:MAG: biotin--[acetyl-CoA-carboxylase] ligase, partial [Nitrospirota bacterium]
SQITLLTFAAAIAVARAIRNVTGLDADIKWPNDILIKDKKVAGILSEMDAEKDKVKSTIIGIGINVNLDKKDIPLELMGKATSIKIESNSAIDRMNLICRVLENLEEWYNLFERNEANDIIKEWKSLAITIGRDVKVQSGNSFIEGRAVDIDENGALLIKDRNGVIQKVLSGDVI